MTTFKVLRFLHGDKSAAVLESRWTLVLQNTTGGPFRVTLAEPLDDARSPFGALEVQCFEDRDAALESEAWLAEADPGLCLPADRIVVAEIVVRGQVWLAQRRREGAERLKMVSFAKRNPELSLGDFSSRWREHAGRVASEEIPPEVRGAAYVQNHPVAVDGWEWPFDAINEVYFERLADLRRRQTWFSVRQGTDGALFSQERRGSMCVREWPVCGAR